MRCRTTQHLLFISRQGANIGSRFCVARLLCVTCAGCGHVYLAILHFRFVKCYNAVVGIPAPAIAISCLWSTASPSRWIILHFSLSLYLSLSLSLSLCHFLTLHPQYIAGLFPVNNSRSLIEPSLRNINLQNSCVNVNFFSKVIRITDTPRKYL